MFFYIPENSYLHIKLNNVHNKKKIQLIFYYTKSNEFEYFWAVCWGGGGAPPEISENFAFLFRKCDKIEDFRKYYIKLLHLYLSHSLAWGVFIKLGSVGVMNV